MRKMSTLFVLVFCITSLVWGAAARTAEAYYRDAAFEYVSGRLPTAALTCEEGLRKYPNDAKLKMLLERIRENKDEQKKKCDNPQNSGDQGDQNKDQQNKENQDQNKDKQDSDQDQQGQSSSAQGGSSNSQNKQGQQGQSSASGKSSASQNNSPEQNGNSSAGGASSAQAAPMPLRPGELSKDQAEQMLRDFNQNTGERKPWKPVGGRTVPEKDW
jgi:hypothetical protein